MINVIKQWEVRRSVGDLVGQGSVAEHTGLQHVITPAPAPPQDEPVLRGAR
ncbi:hypothetical protein Slala02_30860 [Streptomyces lavendulae subsp. lavendulae]|nr:hypothetical protein Slala01_34150 [Streptomyces lavendulae subsp. lavendulae]GLX27266.1 hypothetical protein Slala02_30860 [Streptomyces lavendulae subsp. lavendulae]